MDSVYFNAAEAGSFGGINPLARYSKNSVKHVKNWLSSQDVYTLHKPIRHRFPRRKTYSKGICDLFQADLVDMQSLARQNDNYRFILTVIDVFTKMAYAEPLKDKRGASIIEALKSVLSKTSMPVRFLQTDRGSEFLNHEVQSYLKEMDIKHYSSFNDEIKASVIERWNRTLKTRMFRYFTYKNTKRWLDVLQNLVDAYNHSYHRSIKMLPVEVNSHNSNLVAQRLYPIKPSKPNWKFNVGDKVRISREKQIFRKGYLQGWSEEIFKIETRSPTFPVTYRLVDLSGEYIMGAFYDAELQLVVKSDDDLFIVEKVLKTRRRRGNVESFVKWRGYPDKFNSWTTDVITVS